MGLQNLTVLAVFILILQSVFGGQVELQQSSSCGGVLEGPAGVINYKFGENYTKYDACVWTIFTHNMPFISLRLLADGMHKSDEIQVFETEWYTSAEMSERIVLTNRIDSEDRNETVVKGPLIYVVFGPYYSGTGFSLLYEGRGQEEFNENYVLYHAEEDQGNFSYDKMINSVGTRDIFSYVISAPDRSVLTTLSVSNYVTEYELGSTGVWISSLSLHQFQPGSPPNIFQLLGLHHSDDSMKTFKINRPIVIYGVVRSEYPGHLDINWTRSQNGTTTMKHHSKAKL